MLGEEDSVKYYNMNWVFYVSMHPSLLLSNGDNLICFLYFLTLSKRGSMQKHFAVLLFLLTLTATGCGTVLHCTEPFVSVEDSEFRHESLSESGAALPQRLSANERYRVSVTRIVDGDTIRVVWYEGETTGVRVLGIETPERGRPGFAESTEYLRERIGDNTVELVFPEGEIKRDDFGRFLAELWLDGENLGEEMIELGHAEVY